MFESMTPEAIKAAILGSIRQGQGISSMAGSFADAVAGPVSEEISKAYMALDAVPSMVFPDESSGGYIDLVGKQYYNITRRGGTRAYCDISFTGAAGLVIPQGTAFLTAGGLSFSLMAQVTLGSGGTGTGRLEAAEVGAVYNVEAGAIDRMYVNLAGLTAYQNQEASGGTDPESDAALLARIQERVQRPPTSGNGYQFRQWALAVPGVGQAKVVELFQGAGTVGLTIADSNYEAPGEEIVQAVEAAIQTERPVGAAVTVEAAAELTVAVSAAVTVTQGVSKGTVQTALEEGLRRYFRDLIDAKYTPIYYKPAEDVSYTLIYNRVVAILLNIPGVENFTSLTVNGGTADVTIQAGQIPVAGEVSVT